MDGQDTPRSADGDRGGDQRLSRAELLARSGAGIAAATALGIGAPASALGGDATTARRRRVAPRKAARDIRRVVAGEQKLDPRDRRLRIWDVDRLLADPRRGRATLEQLRRQRPPRARRRDARGRDDAEAARSIPQNKLSAAKKWWGYEVYFPHDPLVEVVEVYVEQTALHGKLTDLLSIVLDEIDMGWVVDALQLYVTTELALLLELDKKNDDRGAKLSAVWPSPLVFVPSKM